MSPTLISNGVYIVRSVAYTNRILDVNGNGSGQVIGYPKNSPLSDNQMWRVEAVQDVESGYLRLTLQDQRSSKYLVPQKDQNNSELNGSHEQASARWIGFVVSKASDQKLTRVVLVREKTALALTLPSGDAATPVRIEELKAGAMNQLFELEPLSS